MPNGGPHPEIEENEELHRICHKLAKLMTEACGLLGKNVLLACTSPDLRDWWEGHLGNERKKAAAVKEAKRCEQLRQVLVIPWEEPPEDSDALTVAQIAAHRHEEHPARQVKADR